MLPGQPHAGAGLHAQPPRPISSAPAGLPDRDGHAVARRARFPGLARCPLLAGLVPAEGGVCSGPVLSSPKGLETPPEILKVCILCYEGTGRWAVSSALPRRALLMCQPPKPTAATSLATQDPERGGLPHPGTSTMSNLRVEGHPRQLLCQQTRWRGQGSGTPDSGRKAIQVGPAVRPGQPAQPLWGSQVPTWTNVDSAQGPPPAPQRQSGLPVFAAGGPPRHLPSMKGNGYFLPPAEGLLVTAPGASGTRTPTAA